MSAPRRAKKSAPPPIVEELVADYEGFWSRFVCPDCEEIFDIEGDARGDMVTCDACNWHGQGGSD